MTYFYRAGGAMAPSAPPWIRYCYWNEFLLSMHSGKSSYRYDAEVNFGVMKHISTLVQENLFLNISSQL